MDTGERNLGLVSRVRAGESIAAVAREVGLSRERARQICRRAGVSSSLSPRALGARTCLEVDCTARVARNGERCSMHHARWRYRQAHPAAERSPAKSDVHGELACYNAGCHCELCKAANRAQSNRCRRSRESRVRDAPHGTPSGYVNWNCGCTACCDAARVARAESKARAVARGREHPELIPHGTSSGYGYWGCRCPACREKSH